MSEEHYDILGLERGPVTRSALRAAFERERKRWLRAMDDPRQFAVARERLDDVYLAYAALATAKPDRERVTRRLVVDRPANTPAGKAQLQAEVHAALEDGLLRHSRRRRLVERGRELGLSEFEVQLLIAQAQFGEDVLGPSAFGESKVAAGREAGRAGARLAAAGLLGLAMFVGMVRWLGV